MSSSTRKRIHLIKSIHSIFLTIKNIEKTLQLVKILKDEKEKLQNQKEHESLEKYQSKLLFEIEKLIHDLQSKIC